MKLAVLSMVILSACTDLSLDPDPGRESGAAGSVAVSTQELTTSFNVINSNGAADISAKTYLNLLRFWVMQYTNTQHYQPTEWSCQDSYGTTCANNYGLPGWSVGFCAQDRADPRAFKCRLYKDGTEVGWASQIINSDWSWYSQFNADGRSANGQFNPVKLTVVK